MKKEIWVFMQGRVLGIVVHFWNHRRTKSPDLHKAEGTFFDKHENKWQGTTTTYPQQKMSQFIDNTFLGHARSCSVRIIITSNFFEMCAIFF